LDFTTAAHSERGIENFDPTQYLANYADLRAAFDTNTEAATIPDIAAGHFEGRTDYPIA